MAKPSPSSSGPFSFLRRKREDVVTPWEEIRQQERDASMAVLEERRRVEHREKLAQRLVSYWPVAAGLLLSGLAPWIMGFAASFGPWAMTLIFPFVMVARRPEVSAGHFSYVLPTLVLYAQFPIEGLFARLVLKRGVKPVAVAGQVCLFHLLGILELVMLTNVPIRLLRH